MSLLLLQRHPASKKVSLRELIEIGTGFLKENSIEEPRKNAEVLLSHILNKPIYYIYTTNIFPPKKIIGTYNKLLIKRVSGTPLQYLTKTVNFYGYNFFIERGVFIPRPETEMLVEKVIEIYKRYFFPGHIKILDIGTGSGNIAISLAKEIQNCKVVATDISKKALKLSKKNAHILGVERKITFYQTSLFPELFKKFSIIVSNPPYIPVEALEKLPQEVQKEPKVALNGKKEGLSLIKKILLNTHKYLKDNGFLLLEIGENQSMFLKNKNFPFLKLLGFEKDLAGTERVVIFQKRKG